ncbi:MAG: saccharopine dehydrogenase family protein [Alloprevotella sp.]|nr:saccharopine dehydrogenase family protein [Prevotellamassilia sp.]MDY5762428.1 saccharopine dehydrogenase family protein [Alloprevotella sp.]
MGKVLIIGAGGVATVAAHKVAQNTDVFDEIMIASRTVSKCDAIVKAIGRPDIKTAQVDADDVDQLCQLFDAFKPDLVMNLALPYQDLTIMEACLKSGCSYLDTANYEPKDEAHFEYSWQWAYKERFEQAGLTAILGCGFDPGVTSIYTAYAAKHHFDEIHYLDIVDCNAGDHHKAFATNFNPEINIREITQKGLYWENGKWVETEPLEIHQPLTYPEIGPRESYLLHHEEIESLVKNYPTIRRARFWMTFGEQYIKHLDVIQNIGMSRIDEIDYVAEAADGSGPVKVKIVPLQFLKAVLPNPQDLGENYEGQTSIGCRIKGVKDGKEHTYYVYNNCSHRAAYEETGMQGVSYTTGVPACIGARLFMLGQWKRPGVWNVEEFDPDPFMVELNKQGLPWHEIHDGDLEL